MVGRRFDAADQTRWLKRRERKLPPFLRAGAAPVNLLMRADDALARGRKIRGVTPRRVGGPVRLRAMGENWSDTYTVFQSGSCEWRRVAHGTVPEPAESGT
jgi:hypothetical protein